MTDAEIAWAAGLFEGEGSWNVYERKNGNLTVLAALAMTDRDVVERFARIVGVGSLHKPRTSSRPNRKVIYTWSVGEARAVRELIEMFRPWLGERRLARAEEVLDKSAGIKPHNRDRTHCPQGHPYSGDNLLVTEIQRQRGPGLVRRCLACLRLDSRERARQRLGITPDRYRVGVDEGRVEDNPPLASLSEVS